MAGVRALAALLLVASACTVTPARVETPAAPAGYAAVGAEETPATDRRITSGNETRGLLAKNVQDMLERSEAMYVQLASELTPTVEQQPSTFTGRLANWPLTGRISSPFGPRWGGFHNGLDIAAPMLTPVQATLPGQVVAVGRPYLAYGDTAMIVIVAHARDFATLYVHLDETRLPPVKVGDRIAAGAVVGYVGLTGWTTGPHVHFMTIANGRAVNPLTYLP